MHHYGEEHVEVKFSEKNFAIVFYNQITGAEITLYGPVDGLFETKKVRLNRENAQDLARGIAHVLRDVLCSRPEPFSTFLGQAG